VEEYTEEDDEEEENEATVVEEIYQASGDIILSRP